MSKVMRAVLVFGILLLFHSGCTRYDETIRFEVQDYQTLTPQNIDTHLKIANLHVDEDEFERMYDNYWLDIEIEARLSLYRDGDTLMENEPVKLEVKGASSSAFELKSIGVKFEELYNNVEGKLIDTPTLPYHSLETISAFRFRNSGTDFKGTMLKDMSYTQLALESGINLDLTYSEQVVVFLNNAFLGVMNLRTEANTNGVSRLYGIHKSAITLGKINGLGQLEMKDGNFPKIQSFVEAIENEDFNYLHNEIDIDNFIDYMVFESYVGNMDWPRNNVRFFSILDGPFRFVLFDLDLVATENIEESPMNFIINSGTDNIISDLFRVMYANPDFKRRYDQRFEELQNSGLFSSERFDRIISDYQRNIEHIMPTHIDKYGDPETYTDWYLNIEEIKSNFKAREDYLMER